MTRLSCIVPGCRRTRGQRKGEPPIRGDEEWVCGAHWPLVDRSLKALGRKVRQRWARKVAIAEFAEKQARATFDAHFGEAGPGTFRTQDYEAHYAASESLRRAQWAAWRAWRGIWRRMKRQAIERAAGL